MKTGYWLTYDARIGDLRILNIEKWDGTYYASVGLDDLRLPQLQYTLIQPINLQHLSMQDIKQKRRIDSLHNLRCAVLDIAIRTEPGS